jgi:hypothetical protein
VYLGFEVLIMMTMKDTVFRVVTPFTSTQVHQYFEANVSDPSKTTAIICRLFLLLFLLGLLFDPEDGCSAFLRNVGGLLPDYTALQPRRSDPTVQYASSFV